MKCKILKNIAQKNAQINRMFCTLTLRVAHKNSNEKEFLRSAAQLEQSHEPFVSFLAALLIVFRRVCSSPRAILPHHVTVNHYIIKGVSKKVTKRAKVLIAIVILPHYLSLHNQIVYCLCHSSQ